MPGRGPDYGGTCAGGPKGKGPVDLCPVRLVEAARRRPSGYPLSPFARNRDASAWAGASIAPAGGRQARPDLSRDKSGEKCSFVSMESTACHQFADHT